MLLLPAIIIRPDDQDSNGSCMIPNAAVETRPDENPKKRKGADCGLNCRIHTLILLGRKDSTAFSPDGSLNFTQRPTPGLGA
ncbi:hypothetical protein GE21DRAFT_1307175 [Neurospora crassa]|nr:hypothetical protein GE21DRAFT_1307175 [Neurospora crassa]